MRSLLIIAAFFCTVTSIAQDCGGYYLLQNNKTIEMAIYNKKGEESARQIYKVSNVNSSGGSTTGELDTEMISKKGKSIAKGHSTIKCTGGVVMIDMKMSMPQQSGPSADANAKVDNIYIEYPSTMNIGDKLKDATMHMDMELRPGMKQTIDMDVTDRKVEGKEKVTTPAGSWDTYKISSKTHMKIKTMGIGKNMDIDAVEWFAPGFGIVKSESKDGGTEIVSIK
jgi:hypothetical protein